MSESFGFATCEHTTQLRNEHMTICLTQIWHASRRRAQRASLASFKRENSFHGASMRNVIGSFILSCLLRGALFQKGLSIQKTSRSSLLLVHWKTLMLVSSHPSSFEDGGRRGEAVVPEPWPEDLKQTGSSKQPKPSAILPWSPRQASV